jgi:DNA replication protein DnaC
MELDEAQAANERLKAIRRERGVSETMLPIRTTSTEVRRFLDDAKCWKHRDIEKPCPICVEEQRKRQEEEVEAARKKEELKRVREEERRRDLFEYPETKMKESGVASLHLGCSLENYEGGEKYRAIAKACADEPSNLVLWGGTGGGKTHLAVAILREIVRRGGKAFFITAAELLLEIRSTFKPNSWEDEAAVVAKYGDMPILVLDDLGAEQTTPWAITTLQLIIDRRYREERPTIITSNLSPEQIEKQIGFRIASRLAGMKIGEVKMPDYRKRRLAFKRDQIERSASKRDDQDGAKGTVILDGQATHSPRRRNELVQIT